MNRRFTSFLFLLSALLPLLANATANGISPVRELPLDGRWELTGMNADKSQRIGLTAEVPGQVHIDLLRDGLIPDPFYRDNAEQCQWVENWSWTYKKRFTVPEGFDREGAMLEFDGLDTFAEIHLNGRKIGEVNAPTTYNMFRRYSFNVHGWLKEGAENVLEVKFLPIGEVVGEKAKQKTYSGAFGDPIRAYVRRMQCTFGWDWVNRFVTMGIWRPCRLAVYSPSRIKNTFIYTKALEKDRAEICFSIETSPSGPQADLSAKVTVTGPDGRRVIEKTFAVDSTGTMEFSIPKPQLWWPNGQGAQPLYRLTAALYDGKTLQQVEESAFGIRTVRLEQTPDSDNPYGSSFSFIINGRPIFAKGGNWIPADPFPSRITREKYRMLLSQAAGAGMNMMRVWGGGIYESDHFLELCDSLGIMVWHDFMLACGGYPEEDTSFVEEFTEEVEDNVIRMRNHPSIVLWCGDNELSMNYDPASEWPFRKTHTEIIAPMMSRLDPSRPFHLTSPLGNDPRDTNSHITGDAHKGGQFEPEIEEGDGRNYREFVSRQLKARFLSESTTGGTPPKRSLLRFMNEEDIAKSEMFDYHTKDNPYTEGGLTLFGKLEKLSYKFYGEPERDNDRRLRQMEYIQYEFVRLAMETARRNRPYTSGILFWMFNDCWPASGWSHVDYWGGRKAAWYAMNSGCKQVIASTEAGAGGNIKWWVASDAPSGKEAAYTIRVVPTDGSKAKVIKSGKAAIPANGATMVAESSDLKIRDNEVVVFEVTCDGSVDRSYWTPALPREVKYPKTKLKAVQEGGPTEGTVTVTADKWARVVTLDADADFSDNYFELLPGETRTVTWRSRTPIENINVYCWNQ